MKSLASGKRKKVLPVHAVCRNCGTQLLSRYCHNCGQDLFAGAQRSVKDLFLNAFTNIFCLDNKIFVTLKYLFFFPGKLSAEYAKGRIVSYVYPSKLFWFISILFIAVASSQINWNDTAEKLDETTKEEYQTAVDSVYNDVNSETILSKNANREKIKDTLKQDIPENIDVFKSIFSTYGPFIAFLLVPFFAFLLFVIFHRQKKMFVDHMVFALHIHSFMFLLYTLLILASLIPRIPHFYSSGWLLFFLPLLYLAIATYRFYRPKIWSLIWRILLLNIIYFIGLLILLIVLIVIFAFIFQLFDI
jgi:hypothetical protein